METKSIVVGNCGISGLPMNFSVDEAEIKEESGLPQGWGFRPGVKYFRTPGGAVYVTEADGECERI